MISRVCVKQATRKSHSLAVPYIHTPISAFKNGVPTEQVRPLAAAEKKWDFWTTSDAFRDEKPSFFGLTRIPYGETWVMKNGTVYESGTHFILPFVNSIHAVKTPHSISMGVVTSQVATKDGSPVNAYAVAYVQVTDPAKSALYIDPQTNCYDSERAAAKILKRTLEQELGSSTVSNGSVSEADKNRIAEKMVSALKAKSSQFGLNIISVEIRGAFSASDNVPDKLRAFDAPVPEAGSPGHNLSADYWAEVLPPPFFEKFKFGVRKELKAVPAVSLEWSIPSPPDFHHFNMVPKMTSAETETKAH